MSDRRRDAATATVGAVGVGGAAALRHEALVRAHNERATPWSRPENRRVERKRVFAERRLLRTRKGRGTYLAGAGLGLVALPALATGTHGLTHTSKRDNSHRGFLSEGWAGAKEAAIERSDTVREGAPKKLVAGNYAAGLGVGAGAGSLTHAALRKTRIPQHGKSAIAAITAGVTGTAALPIQSKLTARASRGKYEVTPTGVRRAKTKPRRASSKASVVDARSMDPRAFRAQTVGKMSPRELPAFAGAHWTTRTTKAAERLEAGADKSGRLVATGRTRAARSLRKVSTDTAAVPTLFSRQAIHAHPLFGKREDPGANMSRGERRARIAAAGPPIPIVGDIIQARQAAKLSPEKYSRRTGAQTVGAGQAGGLAGNAAGAGIALGAARLSPGFDRRAKNANDKVDNFTNAIKDRAYSAAGKERVDKPGLTTRALQHQRTPAAARKVAARVVSSPVGRAVAANPKVAAIGALVGGAVAGPAAQQAMLSHTMSRDDRYRRSLAKRQAEAVRDKPGPKPIPLSRREQESLRRRKNRSAVLSVAGGTTGLSALGATLGHAAIARRPKLAAKIPRAHKAMKDVQVPLLTAGAGLGGYNSFNYASIQHKEASQVRKALVPRMPGVRRAPAMRRAALRQTRYPSGVIRTSTVRGGLA